MLLHMWISKPLNTKYILFPNSNNNIRTRILISDLQLLRDNLHLNENETNRGSITAEKPSEIFSSSNTLKCKSFYSNLHPVFPFAPRVSLQKAKTKLAKTNCKNMFEEVFKMRFQIWWKRDQNKQISWKG